MRFGVSVLIPCLIAIDLIGCAPVRKVPQNLHHFRVVLDPAPVTQMLLDGPPQTAGMRSGRVVLKAGQSMHRHSTRNNEEILVFLQGKARVVLGGQPVTMEAGQILYIPPLTEHEVHNDGVEELRYIFTVAPATRCSLLPS